MKNKKRLIHRNQPAIHTSAQAGAAVTRPMQGLQGVPFRSPIADVLTVSSPLRPSRAA